MPARDPVRAQQRGWAGIIALLLTLLIVAVGAAIALKQYGAPAVRGAEASRDGAETGPMEAAGSPAPGNSIGRARALEASVREQAADLEKRIDDATR